MSLTSLVKSDKELREKIKSTFVRPKLDKNIELLVESKTGQTTSSIIGVAFDYLFRFHIEHINSISNEKSWVSELAMEAYRLRENNKKIYNTGTEIINTVKTLKKEFLKTGLASDDLIQETLRMAYIDPYYRSEFGAEYIGIKPSQESLDELKRQVNLIEHKKFKSKNLCVLNPSFGKASVVVGGADADLIIDTTLLDIKTTSKLDFTLEMFCQIIGYYSLNKINASESYNITELGIYYSRYAYLFKFNVNDLATENELNSFVEWFKAKIKC